MLTALKNIIQEVHRTPALEQALHVLTARTKEVLQTDSCSLYLADHPNQQFVLTATDGLAKEAEGQVRIGFSEGIIGLVGQRGEPINLEDAATHPRFKHYPEVKEEAYHAFLAAPIIHQRKVLGVVTLQHKQKRDFSEDEEAFLVTLAAQYALELSNAEVKGLLSKDAANRQLKLAGLPGSNGLGIGKGRAPVHQSKLLEQIPEKASDPKAEIERFRLAVLITRRQMTRLSKNLESSMPEDVRAIFTLYDQLLDADSLGKEVETQIKTGWSASSALQIVVQGYIDQFSNMQDAYLRERAVDIEDLANRVFANIVASKRDKGSRHVPKDIEEGQIILVAEEVTAPMLAAVPRAKLAGMISLRGSVNSHAAIMARAMGLPAAMGLSEVSLSWLTNKTILLDGYSGEITVSPDEASKKAFQLLVEEERQLSDRIHAHQDLPSCSQDGETIQLLVNAGLSAELEGQKSTVGEGVGLYRTEIPFMLKDRFPSEREQYQLYRALLNRYRGQSVTMRTLDVGGDKPLPYFPIAEDNPFLGWRGVRLTLDHPEIFLVQIRAMLRASIGLNNLQIMLPMITSVGEVEDCLRLIQQAIQEIEEETRHASQSLVKPKIGVMVEVPGIVFQIPQLATKIDFLSVGSNDLTQYLLAVDRNNPRVAGLYNSYHPAVLSALHTIVAQANRQHLPVTLCGEFAGDPGGMLLLIGMGYRRLSMNSHSVLKAKWVIRSVKQADCKQLLQEVVACEHSQQVKEQVNAFLQSKGLGGLVRAGLY